MDLSVVINETVLNIRTAVLINTKNGYIFELDKTNNYFFTVGGRLKTNETSVEAAKREVFEELGINIKNLDITAIVENFFVVGNKKYHEICFYYKAEYLEDFDLSENFYAINIEEFKNNDIKPKIIYEIVKNNNNLIHIINKD